MVPYGTLEGRYSNAGSRIHQNDAYDEEAPSISGTLPAKRRLFLGSEASSGQPVKT